MCIYTLKWNTFVNDAIVVSRNICNYKKEREKTNVDICKYEYIYFEYIYIYMYVWRPGSFFKTWRLDFKSPERNAEIDGQQAFLFTSGKHPLKTVAIAFVTGAMGQRKATIWIGESSEIQDT